MSRTQLVIFGASGDLAKRKLLPALSRIIDPCAVEIIAYARSSLRETYATELRKFYDYKNDFPEKIKYVQGEYTDLSGLKSLVSSDAVYYFSTPPHLYRDLLLRVSKLGYGAVGIEKPFGSDYQSFLELEKAGDAKVYFIDHYLLKPLMVVLPSILYGDTSLYSLLNTRYIRSVVAYFDEQITGEGRMFFDIYGCVKDVFQSHLISLLSTAICSSHKPSLFDESDYRAEVSSCISIDYSRCLYGQYNNYEEEYGHPSETETYAFLPARVSNDTWSGVPFILSGGKALGQKKVEIVFTVREACHKQALALIKNTPAPVEAKSVQIVFNVTPDSVIYILVDGKYQFVLHSTENIEKMMHSEYEQCREHEIVFHRLLSGSAFCCARFDEISVLWKLFDPINEQKKKLFYYEQGVDMPEEAKSALASILNE